MALTTTVVTESDIINEFNTKLQNYIQGQTNWQGSTVLWSGGTSDRTVADFTGQNNNNVHVGITANQLKPDVSAVALQTNALRKIIKDYMTIYASTRRIRVTNTGNTGNGGGNPKQGIFRYTAGTNQNATVISSTETLLTTWNIVSGRRILRSDIQSLIDALQSLWITQCFTPVNVDYSHNYCHSSCHSSRGRR